jgi:hypothetical protein
LDPREDRTSVIRSSLIDLLVERIHPAVQAVPQRPVAQQNSADTPPSLPPIGGAGGKRRQLEKEGEKLRTEAEGGDYGTDDTDEEEGEEEEERKGQEGEETGKREEDGSKRKQAEDTRQGFQDWYSSGSYSQQRNSFLSSVV